MGGAAQRHAHTGDKHAAPAAPAANTVETGHALFLAKPKARGWGGHGAPGRPARPANAEPHSRAPPTPCPS